MFIMFCISVNFLAVVYFAQCPVCRGLRKKCASLSRSALLVDAFSPTIPSSAIVLYVRNASFSTFRVSELSGGNKVVVSRSRAYLP